MQRLTRFAEYLADTDPSMLLEMPWTPDGVRSRLPMATIEYDPDEEGAEPKFGEGWEGDYYMKLVLAAKKTDEFAQWWGQLGTGGDHRWLRPAAKGLVKYLYNTNKAMISPRDIKPITPYVHSQNGYVSIVRTLYGQHLTDYADQPDDAPLADGQTQLRVMREYIMAELSESPLKEAQKEAVANRVINKWLNDDETDASAPSIPGIYRFSFNIARTGGKNRNNITVYATESPLVTMRDHLRAHGAPLGAQKGFITSQGAKAELERGKDLEARFPMNTARYALVGVPSKRTGVEGSRRGFAAGGTVLNPGTSGNPAMVYFRGNLANMGLEVGGSIGTGAIPPATIVAALKSKLRTPVAYLNGVPPRPLVSDAVWAIFEANPVAIIETVERAVKGSVGQGKCIPDLNPTSRDPEQLFAFGQFVCQVTAECLIHASQPRQTADYDPLDRVRNGGLLNSCAQDASYRTAKSWYNVDCRHTRFSQSISRGDRKDAGDGSTSNSDEPAASDRRPDEIAAGHEEEPAEDDLEGVGYRTFLRAADMAGLQLLKATEAEKYERFFDLKDEVEGAFKPDPGLSRELAALKNYITDLGKKAFARNPMARKKFRDYLEADPATEELMAQFDSDIEDDEDDVPVAAPTPVATKAPPKKKKLKEGILPLTSFRQFLGWREKA